MGMDGCVEVARWPSNVLYIDDIIMILMPVDGGLPRRWAKDLASFLA